MCRRASRRWPRVQSCGIRRWNGGLGGDGKISPDARFSAPRPRARTRKPMRPAIHIGHWYSTVALRIKGWPSHHRNRDRGNPAEAGVLSGTVNRVAHGDEHARAVRLGPKPGTVVAGIACRARISARRPDSADGASQAHPRIRRIPNQARVDDSRQPRQRRGGTLEPRCVRRCAATIGLEPSCRTRDEPQPCRVRKRRCDGRLIRRSADGHAAAAAAAGPG